MSDDRVIRVQLLLRTPSLLHVLSGNISARRDQSHAEDHEEHDQRYVHRVNLAVGELTAVGPSTRLTTAGGRSEGRSRRRRGGRGDARAVPRGVL